MTQKYFKRSWDVLAILSLTFLAFAPLGMATVSQTSSESVAPDVEWAGGGRSLGYTPLVTIEAEFRSFTLAGEVHISKGSLSKVEMFSGSRSYVMTMLGLSFRQYVKHAAWLPIDPYWGMRAFYLRVWLGPESSPFPILADCEHLPADICGNSGSLETLGFGPLVGIDIPLLRAFGMPLRTQLELAVTVLPNPISPPFKSMGIRAGMGILYQF